MPAAVRSHDVLPDRAGTFLTGDMRRFSELHGEAETSWRPSSTLVPEDFLSTVREVPHADRGEEEVSDNSVDIFYMVGYSGHHFSGYPCHDTRSIFQPINNIIKYPVPGTREPISLWAGGGFLLLGL